MEDIFKISEECVYVKGDTISVDNKVHYVKSGVIAATSKSGKDKRFLFAYTKDEVFPVSEHKQLISGRKIEYQALGTTTTLTIDKKEFDKKIEDPAICRKLLSELIKINDFQTERIDNLQQSQTNQRILERLLFFAKRIGEAHGDKVVINAQISHSDLANSIGSSRETVNRIMKKLEREGLITVKKQIIVINSLEALTDKVRAKT